ncbi:PREDICTED: prostaglandin G/H synthase 2-like [Priapulus caudatus]|uniref:Prostaglandin G/H synthase 2-like n=1 Tax=Priapulus caudatus TaxID=37621 RepID=A0ABM1EN59_PRICU|nr:PREDICTED: prostaglandin G/H synthase 2-like [Priapulus caudatus]
MGELPSPEHLAERFLKRTEFLPDRIHSSALFAFFAQHFTHMFFKTDMKRGPQYTWGGHGVDLSSIYGETAEKRKQLRSLTGGKLKMQVINGEEWPVLIKDALIETEYPPGYPEERKFALGHPFYALLPGLFVWSTIWMREHNRVCDILKEEHTDWDDERLYQTARLILVGETIKIVIEDYVQHLSQYKFKLKFNPELLFDVPYQYQNRIAVEFNHLYHWHPLLPESFNISGQTYPMKSYMFNRQRETTPEKKE